MIRGWDISIRSGGREIRVAGVVEYRVRLSQRLLQSIIFGFLHSLIRGLLLGFVHGFFDGLFQGLFCRAGDSSNAYATIWVANRSRARTLGVRDTTDTSQSDGIAEVVQPGAVVA
jgi:hypothetical protein